MKRFAFLPVAVALLSFAACDDDNNETQVNASDIAGTYSGYTDAGSNMFNNYLLESESFTITANADNTASFAFTSSTWGTYTITSLVFNENGGVYTVSGSGTVSLAMGAGNGADYSFTLAGTLKSTTDAVVTIVIAEVGGMGDITVRFVTGEAPDALKLAGRYSGYTSADSNMFDGRIADGAVVSLVYNEDGTVNLRYTCTEWGVFSLENITPATDDGAFTVSGGGTAAITMPGSSTSVDYEYTLVSSFKSATEMTVTVTVPLGVVMGDAVLNFMLGTPPAED